MGATLILGASGAVMWAVAAEQPPPDTPWAKVPEPPAHLSHAAFFPEAFEDGPSVTRACLKCHPESSAEVMKTSHWTWLGDVVEREDGTEVAIGKANLLNNFCIGVQPNQPFCTSCHAGYGWKDDTFDFANQELVDCLVCHDQTGGYGKKPGGAGLPADGVDLRASAQSVGRPTRTNCGTCHFDGGGGNGVKHGDLDRSLLFPPARLDVHMGGHDMQCVDCHQTHEHEMLGRSMSVSVTREQRAYCTDCHAETPHGDPRLDGHTEALACPTCHIPKMAVETPTKLEWDWSRAGQDREEDLHHYLKKKGTFEYAKNVTPEYHWYDGRAERLLPGEKIDPTQVTAMNWPVGRLEDPEAKIWPFKVHRGKQIYDAENDYFLVPKTAGEGGYWTEFDWNQALELGEQATGLAYSGKYGFAATEMYWPLAHMVAPASEALDCIDCHGVAGRMDWQALGYAGDPARRGGRKSLGRLESTENGGTP